MNINDFKRDADKIKAILHKAKSGAIIAKAPCRIYIPSRWRDKHLASIGNEIYILGMFMIATEDNFYAINHIDAMMKISPMSINHVYFNEVEYLEFTFERGDTIFDSIKLVKNDKLPYYIFDEFVSKGKIPAYMNYSDLARLFDTAKKHAGVTLASTPTILHMVLSMIARDKEDPNRYFRQVTNGKDLDKALYIPLNSSTHGANNTTARLLGSHFNDNLTSALVNPSDRQENIERLLRQ